MWTHEPASVASGGGGRSVGRGRGRGPPLLVPLHVALQTVALSEVFGTDAALVRSLSVVGPHVDLQVREARAGFTTDAADEPLLARVGPLVAPQGAQGAEGLSAGGAAVRSLPRVDDHVSPQGVDGRQALAAQAAQHRVPAVRLQVSVQHGSRGEGLAADVAEVRLVSARVDYLVLLQKLELSELLPANLAAVTHLAAVDGLVQRQAAEVIEGLAADVAAEPLDPRVHPGVSLHLVP